MSDSQQVTPQGEAISLHRALSENDRIHQINNVAKIMQLKGQTHLHGYQFD